MLVLGPKSSGLAAASSMDAIYCSSVVFTFGVMFKINLRLVCSKFKPKQSEGARFYHTASPAVGGKCAGGWSGLDVWLRWDSIWFGWLVTHAGLPVM